MEFIKIYNAHFVINASIREYLAIRAIKAMSVKVEHAHRFVNVQSITGIYIPIDFREP